MIMADTFLDPPGNLARAAQLTVPKARKLAVLLDQGLIDYATPIECRRCADGEVVVFDVEVELGQLRVHPIERRERIAALFYANDDQMPETLALRHDFPLVPHLNLRLQDLPRSLCLYDQPYSELKRQWTAPRFVERVRTWLALTAKGKLHGEDQPLEPLIWGHVGHIVLPEDLFDREDGISDGLLVTPVSTVPTDYFLKADYGNKGRDERPALAYVTCVLTTAPQTHGVIRHKPSTLQELAVFTAAAGLNFLDALRQHIEAAKEAIENEQDQEIFLSASLILLLRLPKTRAAGGPVEARDIWAFLTSKTVREVGIEIGLWTEIHGALGREPSPPPERNGQDVGLDLLNPVLNLSRRSAAIFNGRRDDPSDASITCVGAGALGSQVILNLARTGFGRWIIVDNDRLFPHNLVRHGLPGYAVGFPKGATVAHIANSFTGDHDTFSAVEADVLKPGGHADQVAEAMQNCDVILDMSASVSVARHLTNGVESAARRLSMFVNPSGHDLVLLAEDSARSAPLDALEMQYYRALVCREALAGHFQRRDGNHRYGQSCRDVTSRIPQDQMALHAAIGSRALCQALSDDQSQITVWRADDHMAVTRIPIEPSDVLTWSICDWTVHTDSHLLGRLTELRQTRLPNETGGVLIGSYDLERRIAYIVDTLPSPPDSDEWPTLYIRGARGLKRRVDEIAAATDGALHYIGEWHSHPGLCTTTPSDDDLMVFAWITELMHADGFPAMMVIAGSHGRASCFLGEMARRENLIPLGQS
jgi:hypothetical protein